LRIGHRYWGDVWGRKVAANWGTSEKRILKRKMTRLIMDWQKTTLKQKNEFTAAKSPQHVSTQFHRKHLKSIKLGKKN